MQDLHSNDLTAKPELMILDELKWVAEDQLRRSDYSEVKAMVEEILENGSENSTIEHLKPAGSI